MTDQEFNLGFDDEQTSDNNNENPKTKPQKNVRKTDNKDNPDFEKSLQRLETIVEEMENGDLSLEESMKHFEEGSKIANFCTSKLEETEKKIEILLKDHKGEEHWKPFSDQAGDDIPM